VFVLFSTTTEVAAGLVAAAGLSLWCELACLWVWELVVVCAAGFSVL
jgi:hypothetical protein